MTGTTTDAEVAEFFRNWSVYRQVLDNDCMEHSEIFGAVHTILKERTSPFSIMDLGCGDAAAIGPALQGTSVARYVGVDLAAPALELAEKELAATGAEFAVRVDDLLNAVQTSAEKFDVILVSFALHHLATDDKRAFFAAAAKCLKPGGEILLIDVVREESETRDHYLDRYQAFVESWRLSDETTASIINHIRGYDFPEERATQPAWATEEQLTATQFYSGGRGMQIGWRLKAA